MMQQTTLPTAHLDAPLRTPSGRDVKPTMVGAASSSSRDVALEVVFLFTYIGLDYIQNVNGMRLVEGNMQAPRGIPATMSIPYTSHGNTPTTITPKAITSTSITPTPTTPSTITPTSRNPTTITTTNSNSNFNHHQITGSAHQSTQLINSTEQPPLHDVSILLHPSTGLGLSTVADTGWHDNGGTEVSSRGRSMQPHYAITPRLTFTPTVTATMSSAVGRKTRTVGSDVTSHSHLVDGNVSGGGFTSGTGYQNRSANVVIVESNVIEAVNSSDIDVGSASSAVLSGHAGSSEFIDPPVSSTTISALSSIKHQLLLLSTNLITNSKDDHKTVSGPPGTNGVVMDEYLPSTIREREGVTPSLIESATSGSHIENEHTTFTPSVMTRASAYISSDISWQDSSARYSEVEYSEVDQAVEGFADGADDNLGSFSDVQVVPSPTDVSITSIHSLKSVTGPVKHEQSLNDPSITSKAHASLSNLLSDELLIFPMSTVAANFASIQFESTVHDSFPVTEQQLFGSNIVSQGTSSLVDEAIVVSKATPSLASVTTTDSIKLVVDNTTYEDSDIYSDSSSNIFPTQSIYFLSSLSSMFLSEIPMNTMRTITSERKLLLTRPQGGGGAHPPIRSSFHLPSTSPHASTIFPSQPISSYLFSSTIYLLESSYMSSITSYTSSITSYTVLPTTQQVSLTSVVSSAPYQSSPFATNPLRSQTIYSGTASSTSSMKPIIPRTSWHSHSSSEISPTPSGSPLSLIPSIHSGFHGSSSLATSSPITVLTVQAGNESSSNLDYQSTSMLSTATNTEPSHLVTPGQSSTVVAVGSTRELSPSISEYISTTNPSHHTTSSSSRELSIVALTTDAELVLGTTTTASASISWRTVEADTSKSNLDFFKPVEQSTLKPPTTVMHQKFSLKTSDAISLVTSQTIFSSAETPSTYITFYLRMTWSYFCGHRREFEKVLLSIREKPVKNKFKLVVMCDECKSTYTAEQRSGEISVRVYMGDITGNYNKHMTDKFAGRLNINVLDKQAGNFNGKFVRIELNVKGLPRTLYIKTFDWPIVTVIGIAVASILSTLIVTLVIAQVLIIRRRRACKAMREVGYDSARPSLDMHSLEDSIQMIAISKVAARNKMDYTNPAMDSDSSKDYTSNPLTLHGLQDILMDPNSEEIMDEYMMLPNPMPKENELPPGVEDKNRYANVVPIAETRVPIPSTLGRGHTGYINANFVRGFSGKSRMYIATQAPMEKTRVDFWQMVWQQQSQVILMLTAFEENGKPKCAPYWPNTEGSDIVRIYNDFHIQLQYRDVTPFWTRSVLRLKNMETNLCREVQHMWFTAWPHTGVPDDPGVVLLFLEAARPFMETSHGPTIVHCSPGTGRTGTLLAIDMSLRQLACTRMLDVLQTVRQLREDRAGAVQTKHQYQFIYKTLLEKAVGQPTPSCSSISSSFISEPI